jgi:hypothetical protein
MKNRHTRISLLSLLALVLAALGLMANKPAAKPAVNSAAQLKEAVVKMIDANPGIALDFSKESGEACMNTNFSLGGHMAHYALDPKKTDEDIVDMIDATPFVKAGLDLKKFKTMPGVGKMEPYTWYHLPAGQPEPHHGGKTFNFPMLIRATNVL